jgi:hypothetical protein
MEAVPSFHPNVTCDGCGSSPLTGPRFKGLSHEIDLIFFIYNFYN